MKYILVFFGIILLVLFAAFLNGILVYFLWNALMPSLFGLPFLTFWQSVGLSLLASCLFKSTSSNNSESN